MGLGLTESNPGTVESTVPDPTLKNTKPFLSFIFSSSPWCYKDCFLALAKIHLNCIEGGGPNLPRPKNVRNYLKMHSCTAAQLQPKVIFFGLLCFSFRPYSCKMCILDLAKIQLNCIAEGQICPGLKNGRLSDVWWNYYSSCFFSFGFTPWYNQG